MYRLKAEALLLGNESNAGSHTQSLLDKLPLTIARSQSARSLELRAAPRSSPPLALSGQRDRSLAISLAPIYGWFTEGFGHARSEGSEGVARGTVVIEGDQ